MTRRSLSRLLAVALWPVLGAVFVASENNSFLPRFVDVAQQAGLTLLNICGAAQKDYIVEVNGNGAAFLDFDNDGNLDVLIVNGSTLANIKKDGDPMAALYKNDGKGKFIDVTARSGMIRKGWGMGACVADFDNDGFDDVYVTAFGPNVLYRNNGDGTFSDVTAKAGVGDAHWSTNCAFGDYDRDGYVDLYVANYIAFDEKTTPKAGTSTACQYMGLNVMCGPKGLAGEPDTLYHNNGNGTFTEVTKAAGINDPNLYGFGVIFSDLDDDGWPDIFVANDSVPNLFFKNNRNGTFSEIALLAGVALSGEGRAQAGMGIDIADYDNDGKFDIFKTNFSHDTDTLYKNLGEGFFGDETFAAGLGDVSLPYLGWGTGFADFDNDGWLDIFIANGHVYPDIDNFGRGTTYLERKELYRNLGNGRFQDVSKEIGGGLLIEKSSRGAAFGDFDNDGDIDVLVINLNDRPTLLRNDVSNGNHWLTLRLAGTKSNRDAIGAKVEIEVEGMKRIAEVRSGGSYLSNNDIRIHFGLGKATKVTHVNVRWPNGGVEKFGEMRADQFVTLHEGKGAEPAR